MKRSRAFRIIFLSVLFSSTSTEIDKNEFPKDFVFGTGTSAYQVEGAWNESGKGENNWDRYTHEHPYFILNRQNGDISCDSYHKIAEDVALIKELGAKWYRFSLSWSRILPSGFAYQVNGLGISYYNQLIDDLLANNITPFITLFHWDTPQPLQNLGGFANDRMVEWFEDYARVAFHHFGDRVKLWSTFNEPLEICEGGYAANDKAPGYNSSGIGNYLCAHVLLKAHARVYHLYKDKFKPTQNGLVTITLDSPWAYPDPHDTTEQDRAASERFMQFHLGWFADPIYHPNGNYPEVMRKLIVEQSVTEGFRKSRLPEFTQEEIDYIKGTSDFFGLNHYSSVCVKDVKGLSHDGIPSFYRDMQCRTRFLPEWPSSASSWLKVVPDGFRQLLKWIKNRYGDIPIYVTENGYSDKGELEDENRINYYKLYLNALLDAIYEDKVNVKGYIAWSLLDNFEWRDGYENRFGLHHVDFNDTDRKRQTKASARYLKEVFTTRRLT